MWRNYTTVFVIIGIIVGLMTPIVRPGPSRALMIFAAVTVSALVGIAMDLMRIGVTALIARLRIRKRETKIDGAGSDVQMTRDEPRSSS